MKLFLVGAIFIGLVGCNNATDIDGEIDTQLTVWDLQGHRGARGIMPENTIPAMIKALELGVNTLEMDICITKDSICILSHEPFFNHEISTRPDGVLVSETEEKSLNIYTMTYAETQTFDVGLRPHPRFEEQEKMSATKPALMDVINAVKDWCKKQNKSLPNFNIETKSNILTDDVYHPKPAEFAELLMKVIQEAGIVEKTTIQSFDFRTLQYLNIHYPQQSLAALIEDFDNSTYKEQISRLGFKPNIYSPAYELVDAALVKATKNDSIKIIPWTINDTTEANRLRALGVDGIITDFPDRIK